MRFLFIRQQKNIYVPSVVAHSLITTRMNHAFVNLSEMNDYAIETPEPPRPTSEYLKTPKHNGRIQLHPNEMISAYPFASSPNKMVNSSCQLSHLQESTLLSKAYFSSENATILQNAIRKEVHERTQLHIPSQDVEQLQIVMRSIFLQYSTNRVDSVPLIREQIVTLNRKVLDYCIPNIISNVKQYQHYRKDITKLPVPMDYGMSTSRAGTKSLLQGPLI